MQLVDELSMIYTTCLMAYASFSYSRSTRVRIILAISLLSLAVFITLYYHYLQDPVFHQNAYALLTAVVVFRSVYTMEKTLRPRFRKTREEDRLAREKKGLPVPTKEHQHYENVRDTKTIKTMWFMVGYGLSMFLGGFFIWNLDNQFCTQIRRWRRTIGLPWGIFLEGHGWWYVLFHCPPNRAQRLITLPKAHHDRHRRIPLHHLGHLAPPLSEPAPGGIPSALGAGLAYPRGRSHLAPRRRERRDQRQEVDLSLFSFCHAPQLDTSIAVFQVHL